MHKCNHLSAALALVVASVLSVCLMACGSTTTPEQDEEAIRQGIAQQLDPLVGPTEDELKEFIDFDGNEQFDAMREHGVDPYVWTSHLLSRFTYSVDDIQVDGDKATGKIQLKNADIGKAIDTSVERMETGDLADKMNEMYDKDDGEALVAFIMDTLYEEIETSKESATTDVDVSLYKVDGVWYLTDDSINQIIMSAFGDIDVSKLTKVTEGSQAKEGRDAESAKGGDEKAAKSTSDVATNGETKAEDATTSESKDAKDSKADESKEQAAKE